MGGVVIMEKSYFRTQARKGFDHCNGPTRSILNILKHFKT